MDLFNGLNSIFGRIACTIQELQDGKVAPQNKIGRYEDVEWLYAQVCFSPAIQAYKPLVNCCLSLFDRSPTKSTDCIGYASTWFVQ